MNLIVRQLPVVTFQPVWRAMRELTEHRNVATEDEIWLLEHPPVFTQGLAGKPEHLLNPEDIPVIAIDRGGQVTYHGPGQLLCYVLFDLRRLKITIKTLVQLLEQVIIDLLASYGIRAVRKPGAPGIYVEGAKIASLGLRIRRGCSYHGLALNIDMDLSPFTRINPCGFPNLKITQLSDLGIMKSRQEISTDLISILATHFNYNADSINWTTEPSEFLNEN